MKLGSSRRYSFSWDVCVCVIPFLDSVYLAAT
jgi:hypothetical protein